MSLLRSRRILTGLAFFSLAVGLSPAAADDISDCEGKTATDDRQIGACTRLIDSSKGNPQLLAAVHGYRGVAWGRKRQYDRAMADLDMAIRLWPSFAWGYKNRAGIWRDKRDYGRAIADLSQTIRLDPKDVTAYILRADAYHAGGQSANGLPDANRAVELGQKQPDAFLVRAKILWVIGRKEDAWRDIQVAVQLDPKRKDITDLFLAMWREMSAKR